jgi:hypothetical protein
VVALIHSIMVNRREKTRSEVAEGQPA